MKEEILLVSVRYKVMVRWGTARCARRANKGFVMLRRSSMNDASVSASCLVAFAMLMAPLAAEGSSTSAVSLKSQAQSAFQAGRFAEAVELFLQQVQMQDGEQHKAWFNAGASFWNAGRKKEALQHYEKAVEVNPLYFHGHKRLAIRHETSGHSREAELHRDHALAIRKVEKAMAPLWEKAHGIRTKGGDWRHATALVHEKSAEAYERLKYPEFAKAERRLADKSRAELTAETARSQQSKEEAQQNIQDRANNAKILSYLATMNPNIPSGIESISGVGMLQQGYSGYSQIADAYERQLSEQREAIHQQGQQTQAALADPKQAKAQRDAQQRTRALQQRLEEIEQEAALYLADQGLLDENDIRASDLDSLDM